MGGAAETLEAIERSVHTLNGWAKTGEGDANGSLVRMARLSALVDALEKVH